MNKRTIFTVFLAALIVASGTVAAVGFALNPTAEQYPATYYQEDTLTVSHHDRETMDSLQWENDNGEIVDIDAKVNGTDEGETVSYLATELEDAEFSEYPRKSDEANNSASALDASEWTTGGTNASKIAATDATGSTAGSVQAINIATDGTMAAGDEAYASYSNQSITDDVLKRHVLIVADVNTLDAGSAEIQFRDGTGDYAVAELNSSRDTTAVDVIANTTGDGIIFQAQVGELPLVTGGDGSLDAIEEIRVVATDTDVDMTVTGLNVEKKTKVDFGTTKYTDADGNVQSETVYQNADGGRIDLTALDTMGDWSSDTVVHNLQYYDVQYRMQDKPSAATVSFADASNYPGFDKLLSVTYEREIPTGYELSHGDIDLVTEQAFLAERYTQLRYAEAIGDTATEDVSSWTDLSGSLGDKDITITVDSTVQPGTTNVVQFEVKLLEDQVSALQPTTGAGGFWGASGGSSHPLMNIWNWAVGGIVGLLSIVGIKAKGIGS